ncbi:MAG: hypothetical protein Q8M86_05025 [Syntrophales bacterium]|nr:hypothetical protein [Syntrophales bacterium]
MQVNVSIHEIISWIVAAVSLALFIYERRKNNLTPFYMYLQGLLKACHAKSVFYYQLAKSFDPQGGSADKDQFFKWQAVSWDFETMKQTVMGIMKAIQPGKDVPFSDRDYTRIKEEDLKNGQAEK